LNELAETGRKEMKKLKEIEWLRNPKKIKKV